MPRDRSPRRSPPCGGAALGGALRRAADVVLAAVARLLLRVFFREVEVIGADRIPRDRPLLLVANHVNSLVDPILILGFLGVRPRFLAKSTLWSHPVVAPLLVVSGALPVYRGQDGGGNVDRNFQTFARCRDHLAAGGTIALFPEGTSHNQPHGLPLKTGAARIALEAEEAHGPLGTRIVPVGITYEDKDRFRSRVLVHVGEPIDPSAGSPPGAAGAVRRLTARITAGLETVELSFASWGEARLVDQALALALPLGEPGGAALSRLSSLRRDAVDRYRRLLASDPDRAARLAAALARSGPDPGALGHGAAPARSRPSLARRTLLAVPALVGTVLNGLPYRIPGWVAEGLTRTPDEPATYKLLAALIVFPLMWSLEVAAAAVVTGWRGALAVAVAAPLSGYAALLYRDDARASREDHQRRRAFAAEAASKELMEERSRLRGELIDLVEPGASNARPAEPVPG